MVANVPSFAGASDDALKPYVNNSFTYERWADARWAQNTYGSTRFFAAYHYYTRFRVTTELAQGEGCSMCSGGEGLYKMSYDVSQRTTTYSGVNSNGNISYDPNVWRFKTTVYLPDTTNTVTPEVPDYWSDNDQEIVYSNEVGQVMLKARTDKSGSSPKTTADYFRYTSNGGSYQDAGQMELHAYPSAVTGWSESYDGLVTSSLNPTANNQFLNDLSGQYELFKYGTSTTANSTMPGNVKGYIQERLLRFGETTDGNTLLTGGVKQETYSYVARTAGGATIYPTASVTNYRNTNGTGGQTTIYGYDWITGTVRPSRVTMTMAAATTAQNGSNVQDSASTYQDKYGRTIWTVDPAGCISYSKYDLGTGALVKQVLDVDPSTITDAPAGVTTPTRSSSLPTALAITTTMEVDGLGRATKVTDPNGNLMYAVYNDAAHEVRVYRSAAGTFSQIGPVSVVREYRPASNAASTGEGQVFTETILSSATPNLTAGCAEWDGNDPVRGHSEPDPLAHQQRESGRRSRSVHLERLDQLRRKQEPGTSRDHRHGLPRDAD